MPKTLVVHTPAGFVALFAVATAMVPALCRAQHGPDFQDNTFKLCMQTEGERPSSAQPEASIKPFCRCYAAEMARTVPAELLNISRSAATPAQAQALGRLADQANTRCRPNSPPPSSARSPLER